MDEVVRNTVTADPEPGQCPICGMSDPGGLAVEQAGIEPRTLNRRPVHGSCAEWYGTWDRTPEPQLRKYPHLQVIDDGGRFEAWILGEGRRGRTDWG